MKINGNDMDKETELLLSEGILSLCAEPSKIPAKSIIRRISDTKNQQGFFTGIDNQGGLIVINVIDIATSSYIADAGIIRPEGKDKIFFFTSNFSTSPKANVAMEILQQWPLYIKHKEWQKAMEEFMKISFSPEYILFLKREDSLDTLFIPMQQKLNIGRFKKTVNPEALCKQKFKEHLMALKPGEHLTYIALIPATSSYDPKFYSIGTKPHEETHISLKSELFNFKPTHGGHIKAEKQESGIVYYVDAGSNYIGKGTKTKLETAEAVVKALKREFSGFKFIPLEGRSAFGTEQSY